MAETKGDWKALAAAKKQAVLDLIPEKWRLPQPLPTPEAQKEVVKYVEQFLSADEIAITNSDAVAIVDKTTSGKWKAVDVVTAFCHRASLAHQLTNCLHEIFFEQAIAQAKRLDEEFAKGNVSVGPMHGLPVSFKDQFHVRDVETTMGYVGWIGTFEGVKGTGKEKKVESELVREMRALGAVPFCKTSLPHTVMSYETWNNIVGYTLNPYNRLMSSGGSSGGEGALIGMHGSPLGVGTDIGGSIRIPSAVCGLFGLRPSFGRLPYLGAANSMPGQNSVPSVCGPLASSAGAIKLMIKSTLSQEPWLRDPAVAEIPWREEQTKLPSKMAFGVYRVDGLETPLSVSPIAPVQRGLDEAIALLKKLGHEVIEWDPPSHARAMGIALKAFTEDGGIDIFHHIGLSKEPLTPRVGAFYGEGVGPAMPADQVHAVNLEVRAFQKEYLDYWNASASRTSSGRPVDAVLSPVLSSASFQLDKTAGLLYTPVVNVLDYTSIVVPVITVDASKDKPEADYKPLSDADKAVHEEYDPDLANGTPVGLQFIGRRLQEEKMIAIAEMFEKALAEQRGS